MSDRCKAANDHSTVDFAKLNREIIDLKIKIAQISKRKRVKISLGTVTTIKQGEMNTTRKECIENF